MKNTPITDMKSLQAEKARLKVLSEKQWEVVQADIEYLKEEFAPIELLNKAASKVVPEPVRSSPLLNIPINFIAKRLFGAERNVVTPTANPKGNQIRNIALGAVEGVAVFLLQRYLRKKF